MSGFREITKDEAREAVTAAAWTENGEDFDPCPNCNWRKKEPRTLIHSKAGGIGADWPLNSAVEFVDRSTRVAWVLSIFGHDLAVEADDRMVQFEARAPQDVREALLSGVADGPVTRDGLVKP